MVDLDLSVAKATLSREDFLSSTATDSRMDSEVRIDLDVPRVRRNDSLSVVVAIHVVGPSLDDVHDDTELSIIDLTNKAIE